MQSALRSLLTGDAALAALVSTRVYWNAIPQDAADPCIAMYKITGAPHHTYSGPTDLAPSIVQINVRALTVTSMWAVRDAIIAKLDGYSGGGFQAILLNAERQTSEKPGTVLYHTCQLDFEVHYAA